MPLALELQSLITKERVTEATKKEYIEAVKNCGIEFSKNLGYSEV